MASLIDKTNTPEEIVDQVDQDDQIIGPIKKVEVNSSPELFHREVAILIYDQKKRILFQQRSAKKTVHPLFWSISVAGHVPRGMTPYQSAHKELLEELGFDTELTFINKKLVHLPNETYFAYCYHGLYNGQTIKTEPEEVEQVRFMSKKEFFDLLSQGEKSDDMSIEMVNNL